MAEPGPWERYKDRLERLEALRYNLDLDARESYTAKNGWRIDHYEAELPPEAPGEPGLRGSFRAAQDVVRAYRFPPPDLITGIFVPDGPLERRVMLLRARFLLFTFYFGVRVVGVTDELRDVQGVRERVWGYGYATLEGHFERGRIDFTVAKRLETGQVFFRIDALSQTGTISNVFYRIGFAVFGRSLQRRFARESMRRTRRLVEEALARPPAPDAPSSVPEAAPVQPASADESARDKLKGVGAQKP